MTMLETEEFVYVTEAADMARALAPLHNAPLLAVDTETTGLLAHRDKLLLLQLYAEGHPMVVIDCRAIALRLVAEAVRPLLTGRGQLRVLHNAAFDYGIIMHHLGLRMERLYDTMLVERLLTAGLNADCGLGAVAHRYLNRHLDKAVRQTFIGMAPDHEFTVEQLVYAAEDVAVLPAIVRMQQKRLKDAGLLDIARLEFAVLPALAEAHVWGIRVDVDRWRTFIAGVAAEAEEAEKELVATLTPYLERYRQDREVGLAEAYQAAFAQREAAKAFREAQAEQARQAALDRGLSRGEARDVFNAVKKAIPLPPAPPKPDAGSGPINLESSEQVGRALLEMEVPLPCNESGKPTTKKEVMLALVDSGEYPVVDRFMEWREMNKLVSTYGEIVNHVDAANRLHAFFNQLVSTGRLSCREPNLQQVPNTERGHELRLCFIAKEGYRIISTDYSAIEMRILAEVTGEPLLLWSIEQGLDPHGMTALRMFPEVQGALGVRPAEIDDLLNRAKQDPEALEHLKALLAAVKEDHGHYRKVAKMINFGVAYGLSPQGLSAKLRIPLPDAKRYISDYFATNQHIDRWLKEYGARGLTRLESRTILGRPRYFRLPKREECPEKWMYDAGLRRIKRQVCNAVIQGSSADITKLAMVLIRQAFLDGGWDAKMLLSVHDELVVEAAADQAEQVAALVRDKMLEAARRVLNTVVVDAEGGIGASWGEAH